MEGGKGKPPGVSGLSQGPRTLPLVQGGLADFLHAKPGEKIIMKEVKFVGGAGGGTSYLFFQDCLLVPVSAFLLLLLFDFWFLLITVLMSFALYWMLFAQQCIKVETKPISQGSPHRIPDLAGTSMPSI